MAGKVEVSRKELTRLCGEAGFAPSPKELDDLATYMEFLLHWNRSMNLVGTRTWQDTFTTLVVDSLHVHKFLQSLNIPENPISWDLGAGAGLPGIPLRVLWHDGEYTLVDAREKRTIFMGMALAQCPQARTKVFTGRAEVFMAQECKADRPADIIISRAFMPWRELLDFVNGHMKSQVTNKAKESAEAEGSQVDENQASRIIFLTLEPMPQDIPEGWQAEAEMAYDTRVGRRYLWSIQPS
ncbi:MAG: RsmG family class I SAM-dependent methyltransferase [Pseudomonadota bacterium]